MLRSALLIIGTFALMLVCGAAATVGTLRTLMSLGLRYHDNYEYYGQTPAVLLLPVAGILAFVATGIIVWRLHNNRWRVSLRALLVATTVFAVGLGLFIFLNKVPPSPPLDHGDLVAPMRTLKR